MHCHYSHYNKNNIKYIFFQDPSSNPTKECVGFYLTVPLSVATAVNPQLASVTEKRPKLFNMHTPRVKEDLRPAVDKTVDK